MQRLGWLILVLVVTLALGTLSVGSEDAALSDLTRLTQALAAKATAENYARLEAFADQHAGTEAGGRAAFRLAMADLERERFERAQTNFTRAFSSRLLGDYASFYLAVAQRRRGALDDALATLEDFEQQHPQSRLADAAAVERAALLAELGRPAEARDAITRRPQWDRRPALLFALARAHRVSGEPERSVEILHRIYYEFPLSPEAEPSNQLLNELRPTLADRYLPPTEGLRRTRAELLWAAGAYTGARSAFVDLSVRASDATRWLARLRAAQAFLLQGGPARACQELEAINDIPPDLEAEWRSYRLQCRARANDVAGIERELERLRSAFASARWYSQSLFAAGNYFLASDDTARARSLYAELLERFPDSDWAPEAHWKLAWSAYLESDVAAASRWMEEHLRKYSRSVFVPRALYWRARLAERGGESDLAARLGELLRVNFPRHYLGQILGAEWAQARGGSGGEGAGASLPAWVEEIRFERGTPAAVLLPAELPPLLERVRALEELGLPALAADEAAFTLEKAPHPEAYFARARTAFELGQYPQAIEWIRRAFPAYLDFALDDLPRDIWELLFPRLYWDSIERHARTYRLDPLLVAALMRQESRFDPRAVSSAGAFGLMQLMPDTARRLAGVRHLNPERLFEPDFNIRLGARFLRQLHDRFGGQLELVVAAYNAGGTAVARWHARRAWTEPAEFVESIPASQSRDFVYLVLRNYQFYRDLYTARESSAR